MSAGIVTRLIRDDDWAAVERIFRAGVEGGNATFESQTPTWEQFAASKPPALRLVAVSECDDVLAWAPASKPGSTDRVEVLAAR